MEWTNLERSSSFKLSFFCEMIGILKEWLSCKWCNDLIDFEFTRIYWYMYIHAWIKMNKNKIKERKKKLLVSFGSSECLLKLQRRGCMEILAAFRRGFFTEEISRVFGYSRIFLSLTQALDMDILLTSVLYVSLLLKGRNHGFI